MTSDSAPRARWTKDRAGATLAATSGYFLAFGPAIETTKRLTQDHTYEAAALASFAVAVLAYWIGSRLMKKLP
ncbi:hypothetical protein [Streptomyces gilvus]|uniref:hypothetical protein n=1 Tax=Streptomyces gilvus TaxID=2920937 RepID=UPI001F0F210A|nr:hypothetical protein [Streptomyces sp. CME 23]MCH5671138.1 hypothetical protein [Streptomyces sp. CME 23]